MRWPPFWPVSGCARRTTTWSTSTIDTRSLWWRSHVSAVVLVEYCVLVRYLMDVFFCFVFFLPFRGSGVQWLPCWSPSSCIRCALPLNWIWVSIERLCCLVYRKWITSTLLSILFCISHPQATDPCGSSAGRMASAGAAPSSCSAASCCCCATKSRRRSTTRSERSFTIRKCEPRPGRTFCPMSFSRPTQHNTHTKQ